MASPEYSKRLGEISDVQLQAAPDRFGLGKLVAAEPVKSGLFGQHIFVSSTVGEFVLRGVPHHQWQLPTEQFFARMVAEQTRVPAPWLFLIDPDTNIFGWSFAITVSGLILGFSFSGVLSRIDARWQLIVDQANEGNTGNSRDFWSNAGVTGLIRND
jgi:hypothetical protein